MRCPIFNLEKMSRILTNVFNLGLSFLLSLSIVSCEKETEEVKISLIPLEVGNKWVYNSYSVTGEYEIFDRKDSLEIIDLVNKDINGDEKQVYSFKQSTLETSYFHLWNARDFCYKYIKRANRYYLLPIDAIVIPRTDTLPDYHTVRLTKNPIIEGESWISEYVTSYLHFENDTFRYISEDRKLEIQCISTNSIVNTDMGYSECVAYQIKDAMFNYYEIVYYTIGIGPVREEEYHNGELYRVKKLCDYTVLQ